MREYVVRAEVAEVVKITYDVYVEGDITSHDAEELAKQYLLGQPLPVIEKRSHEIVPDKIEKIKISQKGIMPLDLRKVDSHLLTIDEAKAKEV